MAEQMIAYDIDRAAEVVSLSVASLYDAIKNNEIVVTYGGPKKTKPLFRPEDLDNYVKTLPSQSARA